MNKEEIEGFGSELDSTTKTEAEPVDNRDLEDKKGKGFEKGNKDNVLGRGFYFARVFIHGVISDFHIKEFREGRKSIRLFLTVNGRKDLGKEILEEIEVVVEKRRLVENSKHFLNMGEVVLIEGRIALAFIKGTEKVTKKIQYISAESISVSKQNLQ